jgi:LysM repeat protein
MKPHTLPVKRRPVPKGIFRRLSAVTTRRKQRVAAAATAVPGAEIETDDGASKISRALTIIFLIHIVAIGLIFFHQRFLEGRPMESAAKTTKTEAAAPSVATAPATNTPARRDDLPRLTAGEKPYVVRQGDNYARIAAAEGVDEGELRLLNKHVDIGPGLILRIPPKRIVAVEPPEVASIREQTPSDRDRGLVEAVDVSEAPKAQLVRPNVTPDTTAKSGSTKTSPTHSPKTTADNNIKNTKSGSSSSKTSTTAKTSTSGGKSYTVQQGDSIWRIASKYKTSQDSIMRANGISDARKVKPGMKLVIPQG